MATDSGFVAGSIVGKMVLDRSGWSGSFQAVKKDAQSLGTSATQIGKSFQKAGLIMSAAGGAILGTLGAMMKKTAAAGDAIWDMSQRTGVSTRILSSYKLAADQAGSSLEGLATGFRGLSSRMMDAKNGLAESKRAFDSLGVTVTDSTGALRPMNDVLLEVADKFSSMEDGATKAALAQDIFGRSGMELIPMLNAGRKGLEESARQAERLGMVFDEKAARASDAFNDSLTALKGSFAGIIKEATIGLMPTITKLTETVTDIGAKVASWVREHPALVSGLGKAALAVGGILAVAGPLNLALGTMLTLLPRIGAAAAMLVSPFGLVSAALVGIGVGIALIVKNHNEAMETMRRTAALAVADTEQNMLAVAAVQMRAATLGGEALAQWSELAFKFGRDFRAIFDELQMNPAYGTLKKILDDAKTGLETAAKAAAGLKDVVVTMGQGIAGANVPLRDLVQIVATALPPARDFNYQMGLWTTQLVEGVLPAARELPLAIREWLNVGTAVSAELTVLFDEMYQSLSSGFSGVLAQLIAGTSSFAEFWTGAWKTIGGVFAKAISDMLVTEAMAAIKTILLEKSKAISKVITSVMSLPFPLNIALVAGAIAAVNALFRKHTTTKFAEGAAFEKPTLIQNAIAGEAGPEYLLPERKLASIVRDAMTMPRLSYSHAMAGGGARPAGGGGTFYGTVNLNTSSLSRRDLNQAGEVMFDIMERQARRRSFKGRR